MERNKKIRTLCKSIAIRSSRVFINKSQKKGRNVEREEGRLAGETGDKFSRKNSSCHVPHKCNTLEKVLIAFTRKCRFCMFSLLLNPARAG